MNGDSDKQRRQQRWLLVFNCQALGLGNCLNLLSDAVHVECYDQASFRKCSSQVLQRIEEFDLVLVSAKFRETIGIDRQQCRDLWYLPTIFFDAFHPDLCHLLVNGSGPLKGPLGDYQSLLAYAAFRLGFSVEKTLSLYREDIYAGVGYFDCWDRARDHLLAGFKEYGFDMRASFLRWTRSGPFMYSNNHPRIQCLHDLARVILERAGLDLTYQDALPHDNLANSAIFPVYTEIASRLGVSGSYLFKTGGQYSFVRLPEYVAQSFALYRGADIAIHPINQSAFDRVMPLLEGMQ